jgi:hypothetical protein
MARLRLAIQCLRRAKSSPALVGSDSAVTQLFGEANGNAKLREDEVLQIYEMAWSGLYTQAEIARVFWVSRDTVAKIKAHRNWAWLTQTKGKDGEDNERFGTERTLSADPTP